MLTSDLSSKYSESDSNNYATASSSLTSSEFSSDYPGSEADVFGEGEESANENNCNSPSGGGHKKRSKSRNRIQKKVKYWTLPTMSSGTFNPSMLTARQQLQYLAQKSKLGADSDSLEMSPLRLDRIKFEEMKSLGSTNSNNTTSSPLSKDSDFSSNSQSHNHNHSNNQYLIPSSPSPSSSLKSKSPKRDRPSQLKENICSSPLSSTANKKSNKKSEARKPEKSKVERIGKDDVNDIKSPIFSNDIKSLNSSNNHIKSLNPSNDHIKSNSLEVSVSERSVGNASLLNNIKGYLFDYNNQRRKHFENFLKDFAKRMGVAADDELIERKREEIVNKGMI